MKKRLAPSIFIALILLVIVSIPVLAAYNLYITVKETEGNSYTQLPIIHSADVTALETGGFITATGLDTRVKLGTTTLPHMLADDKILFVSNINASSETEFTFSAGNSALTSFPIIVGYGGYITRADDASLELGDEFTILIDCALYETGDLLYKEDAIKISYDSGTDTLTVQTGDDATPDVTLTASVSAGVYEIMIQANGTDINLYVDGSLEDTDTVTAVPDEASDYIITPLTYINNLEVWIR